MLLGERPHASARLVREVEGRSRPRGTSAPSAHSPCLRVNRRRRPCPGSRPTPVRGRVRGQLAATSPPCRAVCHRQAQRRSQATNDPTDRNRPAQRPTPRVLARSSRAQPRPAGPGSGLGRRGVRESEWFPNRSKTPCAGSPSTPARSGLQHPLPLRHRPAEFGPGVDAELAIDARQVRFHGLRADVDSLGDRAIGEPARCQLRDAVSVGVRSDGERRTGTRASSARARSTQARASTSSNTASASSRVERAFRRSFRRRKSWPRTRSVRPARAASRPARDRPAQLRTPAALRPDRRAPTAAAREIARRQRRSTGAAARPRAARAARRGARHGRDRRARSPPRHGRRGTALRRAP